MRDEKGRSAPAKAIVREGRDVANDRVRPEFLDSPDSLFISDENLQCIYVNAFGATALGRRPEEIIGRKLDAVLPPVIYDHLKGRLSALPGPDTTDDGAGAFELIVDSRRMQVWTERLYVGRGQPAMVSCIVRDITDQKRYEEALKLDEARLDALMRLNSMQGMTVRGITQFALECAIKLTGSQIGLIRLVSPDEKYTEIFSLSAEVMKSWNTERINMIFPVAKGGIWNEPIRTRKPMVINDYDAPHPMKNGIPSGHGALKNVLTVPIVDNDHVRLLVTVANKGADYDGSDVRQLALLMSGIWGNIARARDEEALREAKMRAELYVDLMSHDIRNMNQIALGYLELARQELVSYALETEMIDRPIAAIHTTSRIIGDVRKIQRARSGAIKIKPVDVCLMIRQVMDSFCGISDREITIRYDLPGHCHVMANELLLDVFENVLGNSVKHSRGPLGISIAVAETHIGGRECAVISFEDDGPGITDEMKEKIASKSFYGDGGVNRKGLGLYLIMTLIESYDGKVLIEDRTAGDHSQGTRTVITLPLADKGATVGERGH